MIDAWMDDALCREHPTVPFFVTTSQQADAARAICAQCLVRVECLTHALAHDVADGIFGGTSPQERRAMLRRSAAA